MGSLGCCWIGVVRYIANEGVLACSIRTEDIVGFFDQRMIEIIKEV